jgi:predicted transcriptional regulator
MVAITFKLPPDEARELRKQARAARRSVSAHVRAVVFPERSVPAAEAWLWKNPAALASVRDGLRESAEGKRVHRGSFAKYAKD